MNSTATCVFCTIGADQAPLLFQMPSLFVMPDKYPLCPGHILLISKEHLSCYGAASDFVLNELNGATVRVRQFLQEVYQTEAVAWENGVAGQSVFHAHLHLIPCPNAAFPNEIDTYPEVRQIRSWQPVQEYFAEHGSYRYVEFGGGRRLMPGFSPARFLMRRLLTREIGLGETSEGLLVRTTAPGEAFEVQRRWVAWAG
ncbi:MAG: HIT family protein [Dehalococcoidia bacterium]